MDNIKEYLKQLRDNIKKTFGKTFVDVQAEHLDEMYLSKVFFEEDDEEDNILTMPEETDDDLQEIEEAQNAEDSTISETIKNERHLVIVGNPGSGKTTATMHSALVMADDYIQGKNTMIPILVMLKDVKSYDAIPEITDNLAKSQEGRDALEEGEVMLMLDGFNEMEKQYRQPLINDLSEFISLYPMCHVVITTRKYGYDRKLSFPVYEIKEFNTENIKSYTESRTGSDQLYQALMKNVTISAICKSPLILRMVTDLWMKEQSLPAVRSELYGQFIRYQVGKSLHLDEKGRETLIDAFAKLAFHMRNLGYLSDSISGFGKILSTYFETEEVMTLASQMLKSGLLIATSGEDGEQYLSFIHETFQEYMSALHLAKTYLKDNDFDIDFTDLQWNEAMKITVEILAAQLDDKGLIKLLRKVQLAFLRNSQDRIVDIHLPVLVSMFSAILSTRPAVEKALDSYLRYNMNNYMALPIRKRHTYMFSALVDAMCGLPHNSVWQLFFGDPEWIREWYIGESTGHTFKIAKKRILTKGICLAERKLPYFLGLKLTKNYVDREMLSSWTFVRMKENLTRSISTEDAKELYDYFKDLSYALLSNDPDFMRRAIIRETGEAQNELKVPSNICQELDKSNDIRILEFYYMFMLPKLGRTDLLNTNIINHFALHPELQDMMMENSYWSEKNCLWKALYIVPEELWSKKYKDHINSLPVASPKERTEKVELSFEYIGTKDSNNYYFINRNDQLMDKVKDSPDFLDKFRKAEIRKIHCFKYAYRDDEKADVFSDEEYQEVNDLKTECPALEILQSPDRETAWLFMPKGEPIFKVRSRILVDGGKYQRTWRGFACIVISETAEPHDIEVTVQRPLLALATDWLKANAYRLPKSRMIKEILKKQWNQPIKDLHKLGLAGYIPYTCVNEAVIRPNHFGFVISSMPDCRVAMLNCSETEKYTKYRYDILKKGNLVLEYNNYLELVTPESKTEALIRRIYRKGKVVYRTRYKAIIETQYESKKYSVYDADGTLSPSDEVWFFPTKLRVTYPEDCFAAYDPIKSFPDGNI